MSSLATFRAGNFGLESGETLRDVKVAYHLEGKVAPGGGNVVLVFHALTGSPIDFDIPSAIKRCRSVSANIFMKDAL